MLRRANGRVDGFVIESPTAGGHNAPPRGKLQLNAAGEPVYGERDRVDLEELRALGVPFWLAGGYGNAAKLREALEQGAAGVQVGTAFAFSSESGMRPDLKKRLMAQAIAGIRCCVYRSSGLAHRIPVQGCASSKALRRDPPFIRQRKRVCDLGYLREPYCWAKARLAIAARPSRWRITLPRAAKLRIRWAASACAMP